MQGDVAGAEKQVERARKAGAAAAAVVPVEVLALEARGDWTAIGEAMDQPIEGLDEATRLAWLGMAQHNLGDSTAARRTLEAALAANPTGDIANRARTAHAATQVAAGDRDAGMRELDEVLKSDPDYAPAALAKASFLNMQGDPAGAEKALAALPAADPKNPISARDRVTTLGALTETRLALGEVDKARESAVQLEKAAPASAVAPLMLGRVALAADDTARAVNELQKAVQRAPDYPQARMMLAVAYLRQGKPALAEAELERVVQMDPDNVDARKLLAEAQIRAGRPKAALDSLDPLLAANTSDPGVYQLVGQARILEGDPAGAQNVWEQGLQAAPDSVDLKLNSAASALAAGDRQKALELLTEVPDDLGGVRKRRLQVIALASGKDKELARLEIEALAKRSPDDAELQVLAGAWFATQRDFNAAEVAFQQALKAAPNDGRAMLGMSQLSAQRGDAAGARKWLELWHERDPKSVEASLRLAQAEFAAGNEEAGMKLIDQATAGPDAKAEAYGMAGRVLLDAKLPDAALVRFKEAVRRAPDNKLLQFDLARAQFAANDRAGARATLEKVLAADPNWGPGIAAMAQIAIAEGKTEEALGLADRLKRVGKNPGPGLVLEGDIYMSSRQFDKAVVAYAAANDVTPSARLAIAEYQARVAAGRQPVTAPLGAWLQKNPGDMAVRVRLAEAIEQSGDLPGAMRQYEKALAAAPDNVLVLNNLAVIYGRMGDKRAVETARRAFEKAPGEPAIADTYGWNLVAAGETAEGLKILRQAHEKAKDAPEIQYHLGVALARSGDKAGARQALAAALQAADKGARWKADAERELAALE
jgi:predicted Zn-dependent protease